MPLLPCSTPFWSLVLGLGSSSHLGIPPPPSFPVQYWLPLSGLGTELPSHLLRFQVPTHQLFMSPQHLLLTGGAVAEVKRLKGPGTL